MVMSPGDLGGGNGRCLLMGYGGAPSTHPNKSHGELDLERALKWKFLLPILLLRKPPSNLGTRAKVLQPVVTRRMAMYDAGDFSGLIVDLEKDILLAQFIHHVDNRTLEEVDEAKLWRAGELLS